MNNVIGLSLVAFGKLENGMLVKVSHDCDDYQVIVKNGDEKITERWFSKCCGMAHAVQSTLHQELMVDDKITLTMV